MKKLASLFLMFTVFSYTNAQDLAGVWVSTDKQKNDKTGIILNFDTNVVGHIKNETSGKMTVNKKQTKIKADGIKGKLAVHQANRKSLVLKGKNSSYIFKKLDSKSKISMSKKELGRFLTDQFCDQIQGIKAQFTREQFFLDKKNKKPHKRNQFINYTQRDNGYWYIKKVKGLALLVFTTGQNQPENIFQITSMSLNGFKLNQLQNSRQVYNLTELKPCL